MRILVGVLATVVALATLSPASAEEYDLSKVAPVKVGDQFLTKTRRETSDVMVSPEGKSLMDAAEKFVDETVFEILAIDQAGRPTEVRQTVTGAECQQQDKTTETRVKKVVLSEVVGTLRKAKYEFATDTTTLASARMKELSASQVGLAKRYFSLCEALPTRPDAFLYLFPPGPVASGATWEVDRNRLDQWLQAEPISAKMNAKGKSARFKLEAVRDGIAEITGDTEMTVTVNGIPTDVKISMNHKIDLRTGFLVATEGTWAMDVNGNQGTVKDRAKESATIQYKPGSGVASALPKNLNPLGWAAPDRDTNNFRDAARGLSLDLPKGYSQDGPASASPALLTFSGRDHQAHIVVALASYTISADKEEMGPDILKGLEESLKGFHLVSRSHITLPDNVLGEVFDATVAGGDQAAFCLYAIADRRVATVMAIAPANNAEAVEEIRKVVRSLRLFDPEEPK
jgi:hypothetical protein